MNIENNSRNLNRWKKEIKGGFSVDSLQVSFCFTRRGRRTQQRSLWSDLYTHTHAQDYQIVVSLLNAALQ